LASYVEVVVRSNSTYTDNLFTYQIPDYFDGKIEVGHRVLVPFGRGNKPVEAFVFKLIDKFDEGFKVKDIVEILDESPIFREEDIELVTWMKNRYLCTYIDCINLIYPKGYKLDNYKVIIRGDKLKYIGTSLEEEILAELKQDEREIVKKLFYSKGKVKVDKLNYIQNINNVINRLEKKEYIKLIWEYDDRENEKKVCYASLCFKYDELDEYTEANKIRIGKSQKKIIDFLSDNDDVEINDLIDLLGVSRQSISTLGTKGI